MLFLQLVTSNTTLPCAPMTHPITLTARVSLHWKAEDSGLTFTLWVPHMELGIYNGCYDALPRFPLKKEGLNPPFSRKANLSYHLSLGISHLWSHFLPWAPSVHRLNHTWIKRTCLLAPTQVNSKEPFSFAAQLLSSPFHSDDPHCSH